MSKASTKRQIKGLKGSLSSLIASSLATFLTHPLEVVSTRLKVLDGTNTNKVPKYSGMCDAFKKIYFDEGLKAYYKGVYLNLFGNVVANMFFFFFYEYAKEYFDYNRNPTNKKLFYMSAEAAVISTTLTSPIWMFKTRMILYSKSSSENGWEIFKQVVTDMRKNEKPTAIFKGFGASLLLSSYGIVQMPIYEKTKTMLSYKETSPINMNKNQLIPFLAGAISRCIATCIFYPLTLVRARVQQRQISANELKLRKLSSDEEIRTYKGVIDCTIKTFKFEGMYGFYKGLWPSLIKVVPNSAFFFYFYALCLKLFKTY